MKTKKESEDIRLYRFVLDNERMMPPWAKFIRSKSPLVSVDDVGGGKIAVNCNKYWVAARFEAVRGFGGCVADHYRQELLDLIKDPIILGMALAAPDDEIIMGGDATLAASRHYNEQGGTKAQSIGGPINAIRALILGGIKKRTPADKLVGPYGK